MIPVHLQWQRPVDGVEIIVDPAVAAIQTEGDGRVAQVRSNRMDPVTYDVRSLENPIVLHFINCQDDSQRAAFLSRFGMLRHESRMHMPEVEVEQETLTVGLILSTSPSYTTKAAHANHVMREVVLKPSFDQAGPDGSLRLMLHPNSLISLMAMEVALAHEAGAVVTSCQNCSKFYLTGPLTGRRSHAKFCSDRCRVAAMRKRNAGKD